VGKEAQVEAERSSMRKIDEVLRLKWEPGLTNQTFAKSSSITRSTVGEYVRRAKDARLGWPLPGKLDEAELERRLFPQAPGVPAGSRLLPDWTEIHGEPRRKGVTLFLLWEEYRQANPEGYQYSWLCEQYRRWAEERDLVMRQEHRAGKNIFVDYAGQPVPVVDRATGEIRDAQIFIAVLDAKSYTFAETSWSQSLANWIGSHVRAFAFLGRVSGNGVGNGRE
jgi:transposase